MSFPKKSLGQNFLTDLNIIKKIINLTKIKNRNIIEIGPGKGALTDKILEKNPKSLILIEKDNNLFNKLVKKYINNKNIKVYNEDILKFDLEKIVKKKTIIFGNLPYNISSQILIKLIKFNTWPPNFSDLILMFQKEVAEKIIGKSYGRLSIIVNFRLKFFNLFNISANCFFPKPKVTSSVIHFHPKLNINYKIKKLNNLENITNIFFSNKRKMIKKNLNKILKKNQLKKLNNLNLNQRPSDLKPEIYYKIVELFESK
jgi:16S rRNA (adenine1518-N6/adenine1519-N6)-dimethyltransferase